MNQALVSSKAKLRVATGKAGANLSPRERRDGAKRICRAILGMKAWSQATSVCLFCPVGSEPDITPLFDFARRQGKLLMLPRYDEVRGDYEPVLVQNFKRDLVPGRFGILEPKAPEPSCQVPPSVDLVLVPGIAFSGSGARLGRGLGYYDRMLAGRYTIKCGVAFAHQVIDDIPVEPHDILMDYLVTPWQVIRCLGQDQG